jgi:hypothetical protein
VPGPIDIIVNARLRLQRIAAIRGFMLALIPVIVAFAFAILIDPIGRLTFTRFGYALSGGREAMLRDFLAFVGVAFLIVGAIRAFLAWRRAADFVAAAEQVDSRIGAHEEIVTLATLSNPDARVAAGVRSASRTSPPSPLFPILLKRASALLAGFDPIRAFPLDVGEPLKRSSIFAGVFAALMILATLGLVRPPSPMQAEAARLNKIADEIARTATTSDDTALAERVHDAASALDNPSLPPEQKMAKLAAVKEELGKRSESAQQQRSASGFGSGKGNSKNGKGSGEGTAEAQASASGGAGKGEGSGGSAGNQSGKNAAGGAESSSANKQGSQNNDQNAKAKNQQNIELQNELAKAEAKIEAPNAQLPGSSNSPGSDKSLPGPTAGANPKQKGPGANPNLPGNVPEPEQGAKGDKNMPSTGNSSGKDRGTGLGDTHLGEFPTANNAQRYLKPGEGGSATIKDARYVTFKIPGAPLSGASGRAVLDSSRPAASTPYVNAPLAATKDNAPPDERQLIPPRYRDLIH